MRHIYTNFSYVYDRLMYDIDYKKWADYVEKIFERYKLKPSLVLDLGCGTGNFCIEMAKRGYEMIGVDVSVDMLSCAKEKAEAEGISDILYLNQDMGEMDLYGTVDAVVSLVDSINYITDKRKLKKVFELVRNYLNPGGLFIFDINSSFKIESILGNNVFYEIEDDVTYIWQNIYDRKRKICEFDLTFFVKKDDTYERYDEVHLERAYSIEELKKLIQVAGLKLLNYYDCLSFSLPGEKSERIFLVCQK